MSSIVTSMVVAWAFGFAASALLVLPFVTVGQIRSFGGVSSSDVRI